MEEINKITEDFRACFFLLTLFTMQQSTGHVRVKKYGVYSVWFIFIYIFVVFVDHGQSLCICACAACDRLMAEKEHKLF